MVDHEQIREHLALSREYLSIAGSALASGHAAPAFHNALHALELATKAALAARLPTAPRTHDLGGFLARESRAELGDEMCSRVDRLVKEDDAPCYPDREAPDDLVGEIASIGSLIRIHVPRLVEVPR